MRFSLPKEEPDPHLNPQPAPAKQKNPLPLLLILLVILVAFALKGMMRPREAPERPEEDTPIERADPRAGDRLRATSSRPTREAWDRTLDRIETPPTRQVGAERQPPRREKTSSLVAGFEGRSNEERPSRGRELEGVLRDEAEWSAELARAAGAAPPTLALEERNELFGDKESERWLEGRGNAGPRRAPSLRTLSAGSLVPGRIVTAVNSDLPGGFSAMATENVFDSATGTTLLIPGGTRLLGAYSHRTVFGQARVLAVIEELQFPDGSTQRVEGLIVSDELGRAGMRDRVDQHLGRLFGAAALTALVGAGAEVATGGDESGNNRQDFGDAAAAQSARSLVDANNQLMERHLNVAPTLEIRPGLGITVWVSQPLELDPWRG